MYMISCLSDTRSTKFRVVSSLPPPLMLLILLEVPALFLEALLPTDLLDGQRPAMQDAVGRRSMYIGAVDCFSQLLHQPSRIIQAKLSGYNADRRGRGVVQQHLHGSAPLALRTSERRYG